MKICSLLAVLLSALVVCSCSTIPPLELGKLPRDSVTIQNSTRYHLHVYRNGDPWVVPYYEGTRYKLPIVVNPWQVVTLSNCTAARFGSSVRMGLQAFRVGHVGCVVFDQKIGQTEKLLQLGTNAPAHIVRVMRRDF